MLRLDLILNISFDRLSILSLPDFMWQFSWVLSRFAKCGHGNSLETDSDWRLVRIPPFSGSFLEGFHQFQSVPISSVETCTLDASLRNVSALNKFWIFSKHFCQRQDLRSNEIYLLNSPRIEPGAPSTYRWRSSKESTKLLLAHTNLHSEMHRPFTNRISPLNGKKQYKLL